MIRVFIISRFNVFYECIMLFLHAHNYLVACPWPLCELFSFLVPVQIDSLLLQDHIGFLSFLKINK